MPFRYRCTPHYELTSIHNDILSTKAVAYSLRRLAYIPYGWLAGVSRGLGLLMAYGG